MNPNDKNLPSFRAGDFHRSAPSRRTTAQDPGQEGDLQHFPFLEKLIESEEEDIERFQVNCQNTCRNLDTLMTRQKDPETTTKCQAALAAYAQSLKILGELIQIKYQKLEEHKQ
jgi:hypothetical protein